MNIFEALQEADIGSAYGKYRVNFHEGSFIFNTVHNEDLYDSWIKFCKLNKIRSNSIISIEREE